jgi:hypothetical protein
MASPQAFNGTPKTLLINGTTSTTAPVTQHGAATAEQPDIIAKRRHITIRVTMAITFTLAMPNEPPK